jgi:hypothetical protein
MKLISEPKAGKNCLPPRETDRKALMAKLEIPPYKKYNQLYVYQRSTTQLVHSREKTCFPEKQ